MYPPEFSGGFFDESKFEETLNVFNQWLKQIEKRVIDFIVLKC